VEIEPGFADPDDFLMDRQRGQLLRSEDGVILRLMRVCADRAPDAALSFSNR
jgi:hypothetical protein